MHVITNTTVVFENYHLCSFPHEKMVTILVGTWYQYHLSNLRVVILIQLHPLWVPFNIAKPVQPITILVGHMISSCV